MAILPVRNLAAKGVITDIGGYDLPPDSLSMAVNARLENGSVSSGPVFRTVDGWAETVARREPSAPHARRPPPRFPGTSIE